MPCTTHQTLFGNEEWACGVAGGGDVARMGDRIEAYKVWLGRPYWKRPFGEPKRRWEDNIKMDLQEVGWGDFGWIALVQDRDTWRALLMWGISRLAEYLLASQKGLCSMELVSKPIRLINSTLNSEHFLTYIWHKDVSEVDCASRASDWLTGHNRIRFVILIIFDASMLSA